MGARVVGVSLWKFSFKGQPTLPQENVFSVDSCVSLDLSAGDFNDGSCSHHCVHVENVVFLLLQQLCLADTKGLLEEHLLPTTHPPAKKNKQKNPKKQPNVLHHHL